MFMLESCALLALVEKSSLTCSRFSVYDVGHYCKNPLTRTSKTRSNLTGAQCDSTWVLTPCIGGHDQTYAVEQLLKQAVDGADRIVFFNWRIRRNDPAKEDGEVININDPMQHLLPITQVHIDTSPYSVAQRVIKQFPEQAAGLLKGRIKVINVWRPINQPIEDWPLAVCNGSSLRPQDLVRCDHIRPQEKAETTFILRRPRQRWYYMNKQSTDEVVLIKNFDSEPGIAAACCPHVSFEHKNIRPGAPLRESIEARALVFTNVPDDELVNLTAKFSNSTDSTDKTATPAEIKSDPAMIYC